MLALGTVVAEALGIADDSGATDSALFEIEKGDARQSLKPEGW